MSSPAPDRYHFASDNTSGLCPEAWQSLQEANEGYAASYGEDAWTEQAAALLRETFETPCEVFFVFNGTAANSLALSACCQSYHSVLCHQDAHIETDECGAPEFFSNGTKLLGTPGRDGKVLPEEITALATKRTDLHFPKPRVLSLTQSTEYGTVYRVAEMEALHQVAERHNLIIHMDGARLANAIASLQVSPKEITWQAGVDVLCLGGTKNGMAASEAVIFFQKDLAGEFEYRCKQSGQLASKMRFLSAPWIGLLKNGAWLNHAAHANHCARLLGERLQKETGLSLVRPVEANAVFIHLPADIATRLRHKGWHFYDFIGGASRFMCSWKTTEQDIEALLGDL